MCSIGVSGDLIALRISGGERLALWLSIAMWVVFSGCLDFICLAYGSVGAECLAKARI